MPVERDLPIRFVGRLALQEKQSQQNYRPYIGVHKWFARRPGALYRALLLAEFAHGPVTKSFFESHNLAGIRIAEVFMGGGTPVIEANRLGCDVFGYDINPMSCWVVDQEIREIDLDTYSEAACLVEEELRESVGDAYTTVCSVCGASPVPVKCFLWVRTQRCAECGEDIDLFPSYRIADTWRNEVNVIACPQCGEMNYSPYSRRLGFCRSCNSRLRLRGSAREHKCDCPHCGASNTYPMDVHGPQCHRLFAMEYQCEQCRPIQGRRHFKKADFNDIAKYESAARLWERTKSRFVPSDRIPPGQETQRLLRHGYRRYRELFNGRQLLSLETLARIIDRTSDRRIRSALCTNFSDLLRYQNMLCRYDTKALKPADIFAVHGFPIGLVQCECNVIGIRAKGSRQLVGSGGWLNITQKYARAKKYCARPFESVKIRGARRKIFQDESIGLDGKRRVVLRRCSSNAAALPRELDAVLTDPPYFGYVQYGELMEFCSVWLQKLDCGFRGLRKGYLRQVGADLSGKPWRQTGIEDYAQGLTAVFGRSATRLKPEGLFAFTFHHDNVAAYAALGVALLNAKLRCTLAFPCPSEMHGSFHIHGRRSPRLDMVFVCRKNGTKISPYSPSIRRDTTLYARAVKAMGISLTDADKECILQALVSCKAANALRGHWRPGQAVPEALGRFRKMMVKVGNRKDADHGNPEESGSTGLVSRRPQRRQTTVH